MENERKAAFLPLGKGNALKHLTASSLLTALYVCLSFFALRLGDFVLTFATLPIIACALLFGPFEGFLIACFGEFLVQFALYGPSLTTPIWMIGPGVRPLLLGLFAFLSYRFGKRLEERKVIYFLSLSLTSVCVTLCNTLAMYLDALILDYPLTIVWLTTLYRGLLGIGLSILNGFLALPLLRALRALLGGKQ